jgi:hypothetical protein
MPSFGKISPIISSAGNTEVTGSGFFTRGTQAVFFYTFTDIQGNLYDPSSFTVEILDPSSAVAGTADALDKLQTGEFAFAWNIPTAATTGKYTVKLTYIVETLDGPETQINTQNFIVVESGSGFLAYKTLASRAFLESLIGYTQRIPVWHETVRFNKARTTGKLSFPRWNQSAGAEIYVNGDLQESGYTINYVNGTVSFNYALSQEDEVLASYNFRWFTDQELDDFVEQGINTVNIWPPQTTYFIGNVPDMWIITSEYMAATMAMRRWMMDIQFQEPAKIFGGLDRSKEVFSNFDTLKKNYEEMAVKMLENKKKFSYVGLTKTVTVPEYTLPGGRSRWFRYLFSSGS